MIIKTVTTPGNNIVGSLNGRIQLDEGRGRFVVTDTNGAERTTLDILGLTTKRTDGTYSARYGQIASTGEDVAIIADPGQDLKPEVG